MNSHSNTLALFRSFLDANLCGLNPAAACHVHLQDLLNFPTGPIWHDGLLQQIDVIQAAAEAVCETHHARAHAHLLGAWLTALEGLYRVPRGELRPDDLAVYREFERLAVLFNSRVWLDT